MTIVPGAKRRRTFKTEFDDVQCTESQLSYIENMKQVKSVLKAKMDKRVHGKEENPYKEDVELVAAVTEKKQRDSRLVARLAQSRVNSENLVFVCKSEFREFHLPAGWHRSGMHDADVFVVRDLKICAVSGVYHSTMAPLVLFAMILGKRVVEHPYLLRAVDDRLGEGDSLKYNELCRMAKFGFWLDMDKPRPKFKDHFAKCCKPLNTRSKWEIIDGDAYNRWKSLDSLKDKAIRVTSMHQIQQFVSSRSVVESVKE